MDRIVKQYLGTHRRLIVPQLGAFIRRQQDGEVVFSELLRRDDGVLRGLLVAGRGMSDLEAAGAVDRFVFEVRLAIQQGRSYPLPGVGCFEADDNGRLVFRCTPDPEPVADGVEALRQPAGMRDEEEGPESVAAPKRVANPAVGNQRRQDEPPRISVSPKCRPEPYVKGLQYGKPLRTTDAYTYVNSRPPRRLDKFMMLAIAAALVAVAAILYGYLRERQVAQQERHYLEQLVPGGALPTDASLREPTPDAGIDGAAPATD